MVGRKMLTPVVVAAAVARSCRRKATVQDPRPTHRLARAAGRQRAAIVLEDDVPLLSAGVASYIFLAQFPALIAAVTVYGIVADRSRWRSRSPA